MKRQYASIDIARYVSALLVVCIHTFPFLEISETFNTYFIHTVCRLAVPFFFTTSGFFFFRNYDSENEDLNETRLKKALIRLFRIYLIWTILYLPYTIFDYTHTGFHIKYLFTYVRDFFLNGSYYHLWFLPALMLADVIVYCLYKKKGLNFTLLITFILYFVGYLINVYTPIWVFQVYPSSLVSLQKHCQPQEMEFSLVLCSLRLGYYFQERVACLKRLA